MKILLTGATGVLGRRALTALVADGHEVTAVARGPEKADLVRRLGGAPVEVDLFDTDAVRAAVSTASADAVIHLATSIPSLVRSGRKKAWATNDRLRTEAAANLVDAALAVGASHYVQESLCFPYVDAGSAWIDEDSPVDHEPWGFRAAAVAESHVARFNAGTGAGTGRGVVLRFAQFVAAEGAQTVDMSRMLRRRLSPFVGAPDAYIAWVHADDAASAVAAALRAPAGTYNVVDSEPLTRRVAGEAAAARLGAKPPRRVPGWMLALAPPSARSLTRSLRISHARLTEATGWEPTHRSVADYWPTAAELAS